MLQAERVKKAGFFSSSHISMDLERLRDAIEAQLDDVKVGLCYKAIYRGRTAQYPPGMGAVVKAIHVDLDLKDFQSDFQQLMEKFGRSVSGFNNGRKMRF